MIRKLLLYIWNLLTPLLLRSVKRLIKRQCLFCGANCLKGEWVLCVLCKDEVF